MCDLAVSEGHELPLGIVICNHDWRVAIATPPCRRETAIRGEPRPTFVVRFTSHSRDRLAGAASGLWIEGSRPTQRESWSCASIGALPSQDRCSPIDLPHTLFSRIIPLLGSSTTKLVSQLGHGNRRRRPRCRGWNGCDRRPWPLRPARIAGRSG
ncbi:hypothetical protein CRG98_021597 [Punica granatum]|uniref:Uncharacterized protein n=1 Tax=Punica granatum TaxID=22663 RepID=A0A2I0JNZ3_PUNGR|nr:hypothetical protein CRG98_021597 [Punica granatum]